MKKMSFRKNRQMSSQKSFENDQEMNEFPSKLK